MKTYLVGIPARVVFYFKTTALSEEEAIENIYNSSSSFKVEGFLGNQFFQKADLERLDEDFALDE
jgi:hypothetical protein